MHAHVQDAKPGARKNMSWSDMWKLHTETRNWAGRDQRMGLTPSGKQLADALFQAEAIEWNRLSALQDISMRLIALRVLDNPNIGKDDVFVQDEILQREVVMKPPSSKLSGYHLYCSPHCAGAEALGEELRGLISKQPDRQHEQKKKLGLPTNVLHVTNDPTDLEACDFFLLYLHAGTYVAQTQTQFKLSLHRPSFTSTLEPHLWADRWTSGADTSYFVNEVKLAQDKGVQMLLAHESPSSVGDDAIRRACTFDDFWSDNWTPTELLKGGRNVYSQIAVKSCPS